MMQVEFPLRLMGWLTDEWGSCYVNLQTCTPGWREGGHTGWDGDWEMRELITGIARLLNNFQCSGSMGLVGGCWGASAVCRQMRLEPHCRPADLCWDGTRGTCTYRWSGGLNIWISMLFCFSHSVSYVSAPMLKARRNAVYPYTVPGPRLVCYTKGN